MLLSRHIRNSDYKFVNRWYINFNLNVSKMKKTFLSLGFVLIGTFVFANTNVNEVSNILVVNEVKTIESCTLIMDKSIDCTQESTSCDVNKAVFNLSGDGIQKNIDVKETIIIEENVTLCSIVANKKQEIIVDSGEGSCEMAAIILMEASPITELLNDVDYYKVYRFTVETCESIQNTINP